MIHARPIPNLNMAGKTVSNGNITDYKFPSPAGCPILADRTIWSDDLLKPYSPNQIYVSAHAHTKTHESNYPYVLHGGSSNTAFADGHVANAGWASWNRKMVFDNNFCIYFTL